MGSLLDAVRIEHAFVTLSNRRSMSSHDRAELVPIEQVFGFEPLFD
jgi:hypothetical protein